MGIFSSIKSAIFGDDKDDKEAKAAPAATKPNPSPTPGQKTGFGAAKTSQGMSDVDVAAKLDAKPGADKLNWRNSIVDLLKLVGVDSSFDHRKELATELGRSDYSGSADDNAWLHKSTMKELAKHGGKVPAEFLD